MIQFCKKQLNRCVLIAGFVAASWASSASAQSALINGSSSYQGFVGDTLVFEYTFAGSDTAADIIVWLDFNKNSQVDSVDYPVYMSRSEEEMIIDGGYDDEDGTRNGQYRTTMTDFFPLAPAQFIFEFIGTSGATAQVTLVQQHAPSSYVLKGRVAQPDSTANLLVTTFGYAADSTGGNGGGAAFSPGKNRKGSMPLLSRQQVFGKTAVAGGDSSAVGCYDDDMRGGEDDMGVFLATLTDSSGAFEIPLPAMGPDLWDIEAGDAYEQAPGWFPPASEVVTKQALPDSLELYFSPTTATLSGLVTDSYGNPADAVVYAYNQFLDVGVETRTVDGEYFLELIEGEYWVGVYDPSGMAMESNGEYLMVSDGDSLLMDFTLFYVDATISGRVSIGDTLGMACFPVYAESEIGLRTMTMTDPDGYYTLEVATAGNAWQVFIDMFDIPEGMRVDGDDFAVVDAPADLVDFVLIDDGPGNGDNGPGQSAQILSIRDIPEDQGLQVRVIWKSARGDFPADAYAYEDDWYYAPVTEYGVWRRGPEIDIPGDSSGAGGGGAAEIRLVASRQELLAAARTAKPGESFRIAGEMGYVWDFIARVPAAQMQAYAYVAPTLQDSTADRPGWSWFMISTHTTEPGISYFSMPDSGYSVDNLAPVMGSIASRVSDAGVELEWQTPKTPDLVAVTIYRSETSGFTPAEENRVARVAAHSYFDAGGTAASYYVLKLTDDAGNVTWSPEFKAGTVTSVREHPGTPETYQLSQNFPNPFNPSTRIEFALPRAEKVRVEIYNLMGQKVRTLLAGSLAAGYHTLTWKGLDDSGARVPSGVYIYKLQTETTTISKKMLLTK